MSSVAVMIGEGFEDVEAVAPVDCMRRAGIDVQMVSVMGDFKVKSAQGIEMHTNKLIEHVDLLAYDMIVIPGGNLGVENLLKCSKLLEALRDFMEQDRYVAAICAGPTILAELGLLEGRKATCYPGAQEDFPEGVYQSDLGVYVDRNLITASGPGQALMFGIAIVRALAGEDVANNVASGMLIK